MPKPLKLRRINEVVGLFILVALALLVTAIILGPRTRRWFTPARKLVIHLPPEGSLGLRTGADVLILGSVVGTVDDISVDDAGEMLAEVSIRGNFIRFVRRDSTAVIRKPLGIGDASVEITRGYRDPLPGTGAVLPCVSDKAPTQMLEETVEAFRSRALPAVDELRAAVAEYTKLATELRGHQANVREALEHLNRLATTLEKGEGLAGMLLSDPRPAAELRAALPKVNGSLDELQATLHDARQAAAQLSAAAATVAPEAKRMPEMMANADAFLKNMRATSEQVQKAAAGLPELERSGKLAVDSVPGLLLQVQETSRQIQRLTEALQRSWLVRNYMEQPAAGAGRINPDRVGGER